MELKSGAFLLIALLEAASSYAASPPSSKTPTSSGLTQAPGAVQSAASGSCDVQIKLLQQYYQNNLSKNRAQYIADVQFQAKLAQPAIDAANKFLASVSPQTKALIQQRKEISALSDSVQKQNELNDINAKLEKSLNADLGSLTAFQAVSQTSYCPYDPADRTPGVIHPVNNTCSYAGRIQQWTKPARSTPSSGYRFRVSAQGVTVTTCARSEVWLQNRRYLLDTPNSDYWSSPNAGDPDVVVWDPTGYLEAKLSDCGSPVFDRYVAGIHEKESLKELATDFAVSSYEIPLDKILSGKPVTLESSGMAGHGNLGPNTATEDGEENDRGSFDQVPANNLQKATPFTPAESVYVLDNLSPICRKSTAAAATNQEAVSVQQSKGLEAIENGIGASAPKTNKANAAR